MFRKHHPAPGARPGTLSIPPDALPPRIRMIRYSRLGVIDESIERLADLRCRAEQARENDHSRLWIDIQGLGDESLLRELAELFSVHPLALEDIANVPQRAKCEQYEDQLLIICRHVHGLRPAEMETRQVSILVGKDYVITIQESHDDLFAPIRTRLQRPDARLRLHGSDYLAYVAIDTVVDDYFATLEILGEWLQLWEQTAVSDPSPHLLEKLNVLKNRVANLRRSMWPQMHAVQSLARDDHALISHEVQVYFRDTHDHCMQTIEVLEMYRELTSNLLNTYLSAVGQRTNEIMKVLTIMSSIFVPITFLAGIYGMNFQSMPELQSPWAYPVFWLAVLSIAASMLMYFRRMRWIGSSRSKQNEHETLIDEKIEALRTRHDRERSSQQQEARAAA